MGTAMTGRFTWERALLASDLPTAARVVGLVLATHVDPDMMIPARYTPGLRRLSAECGYSSVAATRGALRRLETGGFLEVRRAEAGRRNAYRLTIPAAVSVSAGNTPVSAGDTPTCSEATHNQHQPSRPPAPGSAASAAASPGDADGPDASWSAWAHARGLDPGTRDLDAVEEWIGDDLDLDLDAQDLNALDAMLARGAHPHAVRNTARALTRGVAG